MIDPASVAFDFDGVVADTMSLFLEIVRDVFNINSVRYEDITCYNLIECTNLQPEIIDAVVERLLDGNYSGELSPITGAADVLTRIAAHHRPLLFVTARPHAGLVRNWLQGLLSLDSDAIDIVATGSHETKTEVLLERKIASFVDDRLDTCDLIQEAGIVPILFKQPWNRFGHPYLEIASWDELEALMDF